jgi:tRNA (uracil-5-)-methyltransferase
VLATELTKISIQTAHQNIEENQISNVMIARMSASEASQALRGDRIFRRLAHVDLDDLNIQTLFVDPPRSGLDEETRAFSAGFKQIIYISCNPETLHRDLEMLMDSHTISRLALFDQFPYTEHLECGVILKQKSQHPD